MVIRSHRPLTVAFLTVDGGAEVKLRLETVVDPGFHRRSANPREGVEPII